MSYRRCVQTRNKLKSLYEKTKQSFWIGVYYSERKHRYVKHSCHNKYLKSHCRRTTRRRIKDTDYLPKSNLYKRYYDYWSEIT